MANRFEQLQERQLDDVWEMNMHLNPLDDDTIESINRHKKILKNFSDDFITYIHHTENDRIQQIRERVYQEKLMDFARADEYDEEVEQHKKVEFLTKPKKSKNTGSELESKVETSFSDIFDKQKFANSRSVQQAIENEDSEFVMDLNEFSKNTQTSIELTPDRFKCVLSNYALKQKMVKRQYLQALPFYIAERESKMAELEKQNQLKKNLARTIEDEGNQIVTF